MRTPRQFRILIGKWLALLAVLTLGLAPAVHPHPAHAHLPGIQSAHDHGTSLVAGLHHEAAASDAAGDRDELNKPLSHADCCCNCYVSVIALPAGLGSAVGRHRDMPLPADARAPADFVAEALPEPPRPSA